VSGLAEGTRIRVRVRVRVSVRFSGRYKNLGPPFIGLPIFPF